MNSFDDHDNAGDQTQLGAMVDAHLGDGTSDFALAEGKRRFVAGVERLSAYTARPWWAWRSGTLFLPATLVLGVLALTVGIVDLAYRHHAVSQPAAALRGSPAAAASLSDVPGDRATGEVIRLETSRDQSGATVQLIPGATVTLSHRTRGESRRIAARVYRVNLEYGEMTFTIDPQIGSTWTVDVGAYEVRVVGTIFTVKRDAGHETIEVRVDRGRVTVSGPGRGPRGSALRDRPVTLEAGGALHADGRELTIFNGASGTAPALSDNGATPVPAPSPRPATRSASASAAAPARAPRRVAQANVLGATTASPSRDGDWASLYASGDYPGAWRAARAAGYEQLMVTLNVTGLAHLADAARLSGDRSSARAVLLALRRRFPGTREASNAAFLLGRSAADRRGDLPDAITWLQTYLAERPTGVYAEEARGRLMVVHQHAGHRAEARRAARDYLGLYPFGNYAAVARSLSD